MKKDDGTIRFSKAALLTAKQFAGRRDLLKAVLTDREEYSIAEAEALLKKYLEREVK